jgi:hypothetical protein
MKLLIDGDIIAYSVASAADGKKYKAVDGHVERYKKDIIKHCTNENLDVDLTEIIYEPEPVKYALHSVKQMTTSIMNSFRAVEDYQIYLTGPNNYRKDVATILPYKGNRADTRRPFHLQNCREYLIDQWTAEVTEGEEADDVLGIEQYKDFQRCGDEKVSLQKTNTCICTRDKDLDMIPGWHYNWDTNKQYWVTGVESQRNFFSQLLQGDSTDNILGLFGVGKASKLIKTVHQMSDSAEMFSFVAQEYYKRYGTYWEQFLVENARLLWIRRFEDELWEPTTSQYERLQADTAWEVKEESESTSKETRD